MGTVNAGAPDARPCGAGRDGATGCLVGGAIASMTAAAFVIRGRDMLDGAAAVPHRLRATGGSLDGAWLAHDVRI